MKNWKRYLIIALVFCMVVIVAGCPAADDGKDTTAGDTTTLADGGDTTTEETTTEETTTEETTTEETIPTLDPEKDPHVDDPFGA